ncbi:HEAT repeat domain-containing protein [Leptothoe sp. ISB3NOV94-8A]|uniref:HEAT repeat domain-containing protein n=1 Tax=Adonisia turfae CCMR0081 TaxID=2292702 RepID=A0A6M0RY23_9CYAN|nr:HEAT repeat domain-containing protein [Adonisia turfae]MDV3352634.1 HEAT repeat domain-containing protein [Leptothoe sp. LEGE 181152]NEZ61115.1 HEAT repeat domain-containing protein [Adonisia turfae CCMR0081]
MDAFFEQLKHPNPNMRNRAMVDIIDNRDETTIPRLMSALDAEDTTYRRAAVKTLGAVGLDAVPAIVEALANSENVTVRGSCAKALAQVALNYPDEPFPELGLQGLKQSLNDPNPVVHIASAMALGEIGNAALDILLESLQTTDNLALSVSIVNALASVGGDQASEVLANLADDDSVDGYVKETAISALSRMEMVQNFSRPKE